MHESVIAFFDKYLPADVTGFNILEVGSCCFNGSVKNILLNNPRRGDVMNYANYIGIDQERQEWFVDIVLDAGKLTTMFTENSFDMVIASSVLEHCRNWKAVVHNLKAVTKNLLYITVPSPGFKFHGYPDDFWRFTPEDMQKIFADFKILVLIKDTQAPGLMMVAVKIDRPETDLTNIEVAPVDRNLKEHIDV